MRIIECPKLWDGTTATNFVNMLEGIADLPNGVRVDFSSIEFVRPFGTLIIANGLRKMVKLRHALGLEITARLPKGDNGACSYLRHIGFFQYVGLASGNQPGEAKGNTNYIPIKVIAFDDLRSAAGPGAFQEGVEKLSDQLAEVVYPRMTEQIMMQYCLREIIRNVFEHGETDSCAVFAQRYSSGWAEIAIIDEGIGIHASLSRSLPISSVDEALVLAMLPGVSRIMHPSGIDEWENTGFGLYVLSQLGQDLGEFVLASNGRYCSLGARSPRTSSGDLVISGTAVKLLVNLEQADYFPNRLRNIVSKGEEEHLRERGVVKSASKRSKSTKTM